MTVIYKIQFRRGTAAEWTSINPILGDAEPGLEKDTHQIKIGDGITPWNDLPYGIVDLSHLAPLDSPVLVGTPVAPTPPKDDNDTSIATTSFVLGQASDALPLSGVNPAPGNSTRLSRADHVHPTSEVDTSGFVKKVGDIMTGDLTIMGEVADTPHANLNLMAASAGDSIVKADSGPARLAGLHLKNAGVFRWAVIKNGSAEAAGNVGSDFAIARYDNAGNSLGNQFAIIRSTGLVNVYPADSGGVMAPQNDSGWRDVKANIVFAWTVSNLMIRRVGNACYLRVYSLSGSSRTNTKFYPVPAGFGQMPGVIGSLYTTSTAGALVRHVVLDTGYISIPNSITSDAAFHGTLQWFTDDAWPTLMPGTAYP